MTFPQEQEVTPDFLVPAIYGYVASRIITAAVQTGLADELGDASKSVAGLAKATNTHEESVRRLLRALIALALVSQEDDQFKLTPLGSYLHSDARGSVHPVAMMASDEAFWRAWGDMEYSVRTGKPAFEHSEGKGVYDYIKDNEAVAAAFRGTMAFTNRSIAPLVVNGYDFSVFDTVVDVGGGDGTMIAALLQANPGLQGVLFDTAERLEDAPNVLRHAGVEQRCDLHHGNFFESVPEGGDAYLLKNVLNDWDDTRCVAILRRCARAMRATGKVLVSTLPMPEEVHPNDGMPATIADIEMLVVTGGKARTLDEYRELLAEAGLETREVIPLENPVYCIIEARPTRGS